MPKASLENVIVIDFSRYRAGPWCTQILSELGAEVIKVERPKGGDPERHGNPSVKGTCVNFLSRNRNKKSITLDLKNDEGKIIAKKLISKADVLVENFSTGVMERLELGYDDLTTDVNNKLIYLSIKGFGEEGPYRNRKGVDFVMQAEGGLMSITGPEGGPPYKTGQAIVDIGTGLYGVIGILTALHDRVKSGDGQKIETNLFGTSVSFMEEFLTMYGLTGNIPEPRGNRHQTHVPYELFDTKDGAMVLFVPGNEAWKNFVEQVFTDKETKEFLLENDTIEERQKNYETIMSKLRPKLREKRTEEWKDIFDDLGLPNGAVNNTKDVATHPQALARDYVFKYQDENHGELTLHGHPLHFSKFDREISSGPPELGEHNYSILSDIADLSDEEIKSLEENGALG